MFLFIQPTPLRQVSRNPSLIHRSLQDVITEKQLNSYEIRPFPQVVVKLIEALRNTNVPLDAISQIIMSDAALCAKVLRMSNSPIIGAGQRITSIEHAIKILGFNRIKGLAQTHAAAAVMSGDGSHFEVRQSLWKHSLACATACRVIAHRLKVADQSQAFLSGIFHDVGHVFFLDVSGDAYESLWNTYHPLKTVEREQEQLGFSHQDAGMKLALAWGLPEPVRIAIGYHHRPEQVQAYEEYAWIVFLADRLVHSYGIGSTKSSSIFQADYNRAPFYLTMELINAIRLQVVEEFQELEEAYG